MECFFPVGLLDGQLISLPYNIKDSEKYLVGSNLNKYGITPFISMEEKSFLDNGRLIFSKVFSLPVFGVHYL